MHHVEFYTIPYDLDIFVTGGKYPSVLGGCASSRVYVHEALTIGSFLRSYLGSHMYNLITHSIYDTSISEVADIPCRNFPYYVAYTHIWIL
jgi:hypothetical protein